MSYTVWFYYFKDGSEKFYNEDGTIQIYTYENGDVTKVEFFREDGTLEQITTYENGVISKVEYYDQDGTLEQIDMYEKGEYKNSKKMKLIN